MASENMNRWAGTYDLKKTQLWRLEACSVFIFMTKDVIHSGVGGNEDMLGRAPLYHVWDNDKEIYCGSDMQYAYKLYRESLRYGLNVSVIGTRGKHELQRNEA